MNCFLKVALVAAGVALLAGPAAAEYPERAVQLISPYPAGGAADVLARYLGKELEAQLGKPVIILNKPGAGTIIGAQATATAPADGYTLLLSSNSTFSANPAVYAKLPYDPATDFEPIGMVATLSLAILTQANSPLKNLGDLVTAAKADPKKYLFATFGNATSPHFAAEMFKEAAGIEMTHVPYRGGAPAMTDLLGGQIPLSFDTVVAAVPQIQTGKIKALAVTTAQRSSLLPDVPTVAESGYPGFDMGSWAALVGPKGLPADVKARLSKALETVMAMPAVQDKLKTMGFEPTYHPIEDWTGYVNKDIGRMRAIATRAQIKVD
jgi:tripartite-type tricarboxylate transporter receptor subunit TctC